jgi:hypothetical protein
LCDETDRDWAQIAQCFHGAYWYNRIKSFDLTPFEAFRLLPTCQVLSTCQVLTF